MPAEYGRLLSEDPVSRVRLADGSEMWLVTRYADVRTVLTGPAFSRHRAALLPGLGFGRSQGTGLVDLDAPDHTRLRGPVAAGFDPARTGRWQSVIEAVADELLLGLADEPGEFDLISRFAAPFAGRVVCQVLGFGDSQWEQLTGDVSTLLMPTDHTESELEAARARIAAAVAELLEARRAAPGDDVATTLCGGADAAEGNSLDDGDRLVLLQGLIISGFIGVRDLLGRHLFGLLSRPRLLDRVLANPSLTDALVTELLRYYPSSHDGLARVAVHDVELGGEFIRAGDAVLPLVSASSRDPEAFADPWRFDIDRAPDAGLAFGAGAHACPASGLARLELTIGLGRLLAVLPGVRLALDPDLVEHNTRLLPLGIVRLPVRLSATGG